MVYVLLSIVKQFQIWFQCYPLTSAWASSLSWWGNLRSNPPVWISRDSPCILLAMTEHSMCQPGRPYNTNNISIATTEHSMCQPGCPYTNILVSHMYPKPLNCSTNRVPKYQRSTNYKNYISTVFLYFIRNWKTVFLMYHQIFRKLF